MDNQEKKPLNLESLEVSELEDKDLENVSGGESNTCINTAAGCGAPAPKLPTGSGNS